MGLRKRKLSSGNVCLKKRGSMVDWLFIDAIKTIGFDGDLSGRLF